MNLRHKLCSSCVIALIVCSTSLWAYSDDASKPVKIKADSAEINENTGTSIYRGNVRISQGSILLTGDRVVLETVDKKIHKITSEGSLCTFRQVRDDGKTVHAQAEKMVYTVGKKQVVLSKNAKLTEGGNTFASDRIVFHVDKKTISGGGLSGNERVNITVLPETPNGENQANSAGQ